MPHLLTTVEQFRGGEREGKRVFWTVWWHSITDPIALFVSIFSYLLLSYFISHLPSPPTLLILVSRVKSLNIPPSAALFLSYVLLSFIHSLISVTHSEMGCTPDYCNCSHRCRHLVVSFFFFLLSSSTQARLMAESRPNVKQVELTQAQIGNEEKAVVTSHIGSRPPTCLRKCSSCEHCEAVQVPAVPQKRSGNSIHSSKVSTIAYSKGEDNSNYKPMSWKCKCGNLIFNP